MSIPSVSLLLQSCVSNYYASASRKDRILTVPKTEFIQVKKDKERIRQFVLLNTDGFDFPICLYRHKEEIYTASLLQCTHKGCELTVGGGVYSCPCHGSEFSVHGEVLEGPAVKDLQQFKTSVDHDNIYVQLF